MKDDKLRRSLEELFSEISPPPPEGEAGSLIPPPTLAEAQPPEPEAEPLVPPPALAEAQPPEPEAEPLALPPALVEAQPPEPEAEPLVLPPALAESVDEEEMVVPEAISSVEDVRTWQQQLVRGVLYATAVIGGLVAVGGCYNAYASQNIVLIPFYLVAYAILLLITFWRRASYTLQVGVLLGLVYGLGVLGLGEAGLSGDGRVFLLIFPFLVALFFGRRKGIVALALTILTLVAFGWAFSAGYIVIPVEHQANSADPTAWLSGTIVFLMLGALLVISQGYLVPRLAAALARSRHLAQELEVYTTGLEQRVAERTQELQSVNWRLQRRAVQLEAAAEVSRDATAVLDVEALMSMTVERISECFGFYHAGIFLVDDEGRYAVLRAASSEGGRRMLKSGYKLVVGRADADMVSYVVATGGPRIALDVGENAAHFVNPDLTETHSEMTLPLRVRGKVIGVLDVQSTEEAAFDEDDVRLLGIVADQIAVAIDNARRFSDEALLLEATSPIYRTSRRLTTATTTGEVASAIMDSVAETGADGCVVVEFEFLPTGEPEALLYLGVWRRDREPWFRPGLRLPISESPFPFEMVSTLWTTADMEKDWRLPQSAHSIFEATGARALANVPLRTKERVIGQVVVLRTTPGPFHRSTLRLYEMLSDQAAVALERARLLEETQRRVERERLVSEVTARVRRPLDVDTILRTAVQELGVALGASEGLVRLGVGDGVGFLQADDEGVVGDEGASAQYLVPPVESASSGSTTGE